MDKAPTGWGAFAEHAKLRALDENLQEAIKLVGEKEAALDMGAGALIETKYLLTQGFERVVALDAEPGIVERAQELDGGERLEVVMSRFEEYAFPPNTFNLVNARYSLPFVPPASFNEMFQNVKISLKPGGILVGHLFGANDHRRSREDMTFHSREEVERLLSDMETLELREDEYDGPTYREGIQHWHVFNAVARKK